MKKCQLRWLAWCAAIATLCAAATAPAWAQDYTIQGNYRSPQNRAQVVIPPGALGDNITIDAIFGGTVRGAPNTRLTVYIAPWMTASETFDPNVPGGVVGPGDWMYQAQLQLGPDGRTITDMECSYSDPDTSNEITMPMSQWTLPPGTWQINAHGPADLQITVGVDGGQ